MTGVQLVSIPQNLTLTSLSFTGGTKLLSAVDGALNFQNSAGTISSFMSWPASASHQFGALDVDTAPVAQTLRSQGALAGGTSNVAGANWTFIASPGKGSGAGGSFIFQTTPAGSSGTVVGTPTTALTISSTTITAGLGLNMGGNGIIAGGLYQANNGSGFQLSNVTASSTVPTFSPNRADTTTGIGAQASGNISLITGGAEQVRVVSTGLTIISGKSLLLGNAATTGLAAGVLAALTNATIVISDSGGQAYRIPCII